MLNIIDSKFTLCHSRFKLVPISVNHFTFQAHFLMYFNRFTVIKHAFLLCYTAISCHLLIDHATLFCILMPVFHQLILTAPFSAN